MFAFKTSALFGLLLASSSVASPLSRRAENTTLECTTLNQRKAWSALTNEEKQAYISAELCLMSAPTQLNIEGALNRWDEVVYGHIVQSNVIHHVGAFLPWHRLYMRAHEILLQTECGYTGGQPYWDEAADVVLSNMNESSVFDPDTGFGGDGDTANGNCVSDGPFANLTLHINQTSTSTDLCLTRQFSQSSFSKANATYLDACRSSANYSEAWLCYKADVHGAGHGGVAGTMLDVVASPGDPLFFLHHTYLDRAWWLWQQDDWATRQTDMNGRNVPLESYLEENDFEYPRDAILDYDGDAGNETTLNHNLWMVGLIPNGTVGDVMDVGGSLICAEYI